MSDRSPAPLHSSPADSDAPAQWLTTRIDFFATNWATSTVATGHEGYARVLHPLHDTTHAPRWACGHGAGRRGTARSRGEHAAKAHGHTMHPGAQWHVILSSLDDVSRPELLALVTAAIRHLVARASH